MVTASAGRFKFARSKRLRDSTAELGSAVAVLTMPSFAKFDLPAALRPGTPRIGAREVGRAHPNDYQTSEVPTFRFVAARPHGERRDSLGEPLPAHARALPVGQGSRRRKTLRNSRKGPPVGSQRYAPPLFHRRGEGLSFFKDINHVQLDRLVGRTFIVNGAVGKRCGLARVQNSFRLAVQVQPEVT